MDKGILVLTRAWYLGACKGQGIQVSSSCILVRAHEGKMIAIET